MPDPAFSFTDRARPIAQIGIGDSRADIPAAALWGTAEWGEGTWAGTEPFWLDVSCYIHEAETFYGRQRTTDRFNPGTMTLTATNEDGWADPVPPAGDPAQLTLRPGRPVRLGVDHATLGEVWLWRGYIDATVPRYDAEAGDVADIFAVCALGEAGRAITAELVTPVGASELGNARIARILNAGKWPTSLRVIDATGVAMLATVLGEQVGDLLQRTAESAGGAVYGDTQGRVVFRSKDWQLWLDDEPDDGTIGNQAGDVCPTEWEMSNERADIVTQVILARETDETPLVTSDDLPGQSVYGVETWEALDLVCATSAQVSRLATRLLRTRNYLTIPRVDSVRLDAAAGDATLDLLTEASVFTPSRYRCRHVPERGEVFDEQMFLTGINHYITPDEWEATLTLDLAAPFMATGAVWDQGSWDQSVWSVAV